MKKHPGLNFFISRIIPSSEKCCLIFFSSEFGVKQVTYNFPHFLMFGSLKYLDFSSGYLTSMDMTTYVGKFKCKSGKTQNFLTFGLHDSLKMEKKENKKCAY